jgi:hypothetical protein
MFKVYGYLPNFLAMRRRMSVWSQLMVCCLGALWLPVAAAQSHSQSQSVTEHQVKAAMLYKFLGYTDWPGAAFDSSDAPVRIWVLGDSNIDEDLRKITVNRTVNNRPVEVLATTSVGRIANPHMVFVSRKAEKHLPRLTRLAEQHSFLIVTESEQGLIAGSTINLRLIEGRIGFDVSLVNAKKSDLKLSARLLSVASSVEQEKR